MSNIGLLWALVAAQLFLIGLAWTAAIPISRNYRGGITGLVAFNLSLGLGLLLVGLREVLPYFIGHAVSNFLCLWSLLAIIQAADQLLKIRISQKEIWIVMAVAGLGILVLGLDKSTADLRAMVMFLTVAWMLSRNGLKIWRLQPERHLRAPVKSIAFISLAISALLLLRAAAGVATSHPIEFSASDTFTLALPFAVLAAISLVNLGFAYLAISTVVMSLGAKSRVDELTGLLNRQALTDSIARAWGRFAQGGKPFALIVLDIDKLRAANEALGYPGGDAVLRSVSKALLGLFKRGEVMGRAGGGKLVCLVPDTSLPEARALGERMRYEVAEVQSQFPELAGKITASLGVAVSTPSDTSDGDMLARANTYLAAAKAAGRNRVMVEDPDSLVTVRGA